MMIKKAITLFAAGVMAVAMLAGAGRFAASAAEKTTEEQAKEIAIADAGLKVTDVTFDRIEIGTEHGASVYEIEFRTETTEYDYDISVEDGEIVKEGWEIRRPSASGSQISLEEAKKIVLKDAGVAEKDAKFTKTGNGKEDGIAVYEIEFEDVATEFDYDVAKAGGKIIGASRKVKVPASVAAEQKAAGGTQTGKTGKEAAIEAALKHADLTENDVTGIRCEKDYDDGREIYEVEFRQGSYEYEYDIDANDYSVLEFDKDYDD